MRCSDCKYFKTEECKLKPEVEYFVAESFDCFELDGSKVALEKQIGASVVLKGTRWEWVSDICGTIFWVAVVGILISLFMIAWPSNSIIDLEDLGFIILIVSSLIALIGVILWLVGSIGEIRYGKSFEEHDSSKDYNETVKKR